MGTICGCSAGHRHAQSDDRGHHDHVHDIDGTIDFGTGLAGVHIPGRRKERINRSERDILSKNAAFARANRAQLEESGSLALNLVSSPGSGKTSLLLRAIADLKHRFPIGVIEGDQRSSNDPERIRETGVPVIQINTGWGGHLDAHMVSHALDQLPMARSSLRFIENVGNLVFPAAIDLGEAHKVVVLSVTEGEDNMFAEADLMLLNKVDLLPHLDLDISKCLELALHDNPQIQMLSVSARTGEGLRAFDARIEWRSSLAGRPAHALG